MAKSRVKLKKSVRERIDPMLAGIVKVFAEDLLLSDSPASPADAAVLFKAWLNEHFDHIYTSTPPHVPVDEDRKQLMREVLNEALDDLIHRSDN